MMPRILQVANIESFCEFLKWWQNLQKKKKKTKYGINIYRQRGMKRIFGESLWFI